MGPEVSILLHLLIWVIALGVVCACIRWAIAKFQIGEPWTYVIWGIVAIVLIYGVMRIFGWIGDQPINLFNQPVIVQQR